MRKFLSKTFIFLGVLSLVLGTINLFGHSISYAEDLELIGTNIGLEVIPTNSKLFDFQNLNPGDNKEGKVTIKNNYVSPFNLYMRAERMSIVPEIEEDLFEQLVLTVYLRGNTVYSGSMKNFGNTDIFLGVFNPNDIEELRAEVNLSGSMTGNEFQGKGVDVKWIFTATSEGPPVTPDPPVTPEPPEEIIEIIEEEIPESVLEEIIEEEIPESVPEELEEIIEEEIPQAAPRMPKTGEMSSVVFYGSGMLLLLLGVQLGFKKKE